MRVPSVSNESRGRAFRRLIAKVANALYPGVVASFAVGTTIIEALKGLHPTAAAACGADLVVLLVTWRLFHMGSIVASEENIVVTRFVPDTRLKWSEATVCLRALEALCHPPAARNSECPLDICDHVDSDTRRSQRWQRCNACGG